MTLPEIIDTLTAIDKNIEWLELNCSTEYTKEKICNLKDAKLSLIMYKEIEE